MIVVEIKNKLTKQLSTLSSTASIFNKFCCIILFRKGQRAKKRYMPWRMVTLKNKIIYFLQNLCVWSKSSKSKYKYNQVSPCFYSSWRICNQLHGRFKLFHVFCCWYNDDTVLGSNKSANPATLLFINKLTWATEAINTILQKRNVQ